MEVKVLPQLDQPKLHTKHTSSYKVLPHHNMNFCTIITTQIFPSSENDWYRKNTSKDYDSSRAPIYKLFIFQENLNLLSERNFRNQIQTTQWIIKGSYYNDDN